MSIAQTAEVVAAFLPDRNTSVDRAKYVTVNKSRSVACQVSSVLT